MTQINWKNQFLFWASLLAIISLLFIVQTSFWPLILQKQKIVPQLTLPIIIYFFINKNLFTSLWLSFATSLIAGSFSSIPLVQILLSYIFICLFIRMRKVVYFGKSSFLFFEQMLLWSFLFVYLFENLFYLNNFFHIATPFVTHLLNVIITFCISCLMYPLLERYLTKKDLSYDV